MRRRQPSGLSPPTTIPLATASCSCFIPSGKLCTARVCEQPGHRGHAPSPPVERCIDSCYHNRAPWRRVGVYTCLSMHVTQGSVRPQQRQSG